MSHFFVLLNLSVNCFNLYLSELCAMTILFAIVLATFHLEDDDLIALHEWCYHLSNYFCTTDSRRANCDCSVVIDQQNLVKLNSLAFFGIFQAVDIELFALFSLELLTVNFYDCVHFICCKRFHR